MCGVCVCARAHARVVRPEVAAVGTAVVITPISEIVTSDGVATTIGADVGVPGPTCAKLYERIRAIQTGDAEDEYGWTVAV